MTDAVDLRRFRTRVRLTRAWRGLAVGGAAGALLAVVWSAFDLFRIAYTGWLQMGVLVAASAAIGAATGWFLRCSELELAKSIDRRAGLKDRLSSSLSPAQQSNFSSAVDEDAVEHVTKLKAATVYPMRFSRWHGGLLAGVAAASAIFLLGNSGILLNDSQKKDRADLQKSSEAVRRIAKPLLDKQDKNPDEKKLAERLQQYLAELKRGRLTKQEAMQTVNDLSKQAEEASKHRLEQSKSELSTAEQSLEKMREAALEKQGFSPAQAEQFKSTEDAQEAERSFQQQAQKLNDMLKNGLDANGHPLTEQERTALTEKLKELEEQMEMSAKAKGFLDRFTKNPEYQKLVAMLQKLAQGNVQGGQKMTEEQMREMMSELEKLADKYKTDADMTKLIKEMEKALESGVSAQQMMAMMQGLGLQIPGLYGHPGPGNGTELYFANLNKIPLSDKSKDIKAKALPLGVTGDRKPGGKESYVEIKGPSGVGSKSRVPYFDVLPKYRREAEQALNREEIPPEEQKRVKDYFDSLTEAK